MGKNPYFAQVRFHALVFLFGGKSMKEKRIYATSFRMSEDVRDYICSLGKDDSFADNVEKMVYMLRDGELDYKKKLENLEQEIIELKNEKRRLLAEIENMKNIKDMMKTMQIMVRTCSDYIEKLSSADEKGFYERES